MRGGVLGATAVAGCVALFLAAPAGAAPPVSKIAGEDEGPVCSTANTISFTGLILYRVRHFGGIRCTIPTTVRCRSDLFDRNRPAEPISSLRSSGSRRCSFDSGPSARSYLLGHPFEERFRYRITLKRNRVWSPEPTEFCPRISRDRRTLTCRFSHATTAPIRDTVTTG